MFAVFSAFSQEQYDPAEHFIVRLIDNGNAVEIVKYIGGKTDVRIPPRIQNLPCYRNRKFFILEAKDYGESSETRTHQRDYPR